MLHTLQYFNLLLQFQCLASAQVGGAPLNLSPSAIEGMLVIQYQDIILHGMSSINFVKIQYHVLTCIVEQGIYMETPTAIINDGPSISKLMNLMIGGHFPNIQTLQSLDCCLEAPKELLLFLQ